MAVIFKNFIRESFSKASEFVKNNRILVRFSAFALVSVVALAVSIITCGITLGFNVEYSGKNIAVVSGKSVFENAKNTVLENLANDNGKDAISKPKFTLTVTVADDLSNHQEVADAIIENTEAISFSSALKVDGQVVAYGDRQELDKLVNAALCKYYVEGAKNTSTFVKNVEVTECYCLSDEIKTAEEIQNAVNSLEVKTVSTVTTESDVEHSVKTIYTSSQVRGYEKVETEGKNGVKRETAVVETLNGKETAKTVVSRKVVKQPVQEVIVRGTAASYATATAKAKAKSAGYIHPMNKGDIKRVSAYWGDGRGHKGMDFSADVGKPIFAAKGGKVVDAGWDGNYGYCLVIDHGNGYKTRYAHASALCVKNGETVVQGQQIAKVGNTGRSTGPHLHFEILKNGTRINPAPYIGY